MSSLPCRLASMTLTIPSIRSWVSRDAPMMLFSACRYFLSYENLPERNWAVPLALFQGCLVNWADIRPAREPVTC